MVLGIDPGKDGAGVLLGHDLDVLLTWRTRDLLVPAGKGGKQLYSPVAMLGQVMAAREHGCRLAMLERAQPRPGEGGMSSYTSGEGRGIWLGLLVACGFEVREPHPATVAATMLRDLPGEGKARAVFLAEQHPGLELRRGRERKPHEGVADAYVLARYGRGEGR